MNLAFWGAARTVTGSKYLLEHDRVRLLIDYGMFQERDVLDRNWAMPARPPASIGAILLTHGHLDHCGLIPRLVKQGFQGRIYGTPATLEIAEVVMLDSAHIQEEDAEHKQNRHRREGRKPAFPEAPLYTAEDARRVPALFVPVAPGEPVEVAPGVRATWRLTGHILGACAIRVENAAGSVLFSGDVGRWSRPVLPDPVPAVDADHVVVESTYGDRVHDPDADQAASLAAVINETRKAGGHIVIPAFAVERSHEILFLLDRIIQEKRIAPIKVFVDSPAAVDVTRIYQRHPEYMNAESATMVQGDHSPFAFPGLELTRGSEESKRLNSLREPAVIMAGSGMCTGGRIKFHLAHNLPRPESTVLFVGYQGVGTLGRQLVEKAPEVRIHGVTVPVRARIAELPGSSGHGDRNDLLRWLGGLTKPPRRVFVTHGEAKTAEGFAETLRTAKGFDAIAPTYLSEIKLDR